MKERIKLWFECDFKLFSWCVLQIVLGRFETRELAEMYSRQLKLVNWEDKAEMKKAIKEKDFKKAEEIARNAEVNDYIDKELYNRFMYKIIKYELFYIFLISLFIFIVLNIGRR